MPTHLTPRRGAGFSPGPVHFSTVLGHSTIRVIHTMATMIYRFMMTILHFTDKLLPRLALKFWAQVILLPQPPRELVLQAQAPDPTLLSHFRSTFSSPLIYPTGTVAGASCRNSREANSTKRNKHRRVSKTTLDNILLNKGTQARTNLALPREAAESLGVRRCKGGTPMLWIHLLCPTGSRQCDLRTPVQLLSSHFVRLLVWVFLRQDLTL